MAKAGMRRPDSEDPHGTESNHKMHMKKMMLILYQVKYREKQRQAMQKQVVQWNKTYCYRIKTTLKMF